MRIPTILTRVLSEGVYWLSLRNSELLWECFPITETIVGALVPMYWEFSSVLGSSAIFKDRQIVHATGILSKTNTSVAANSPFDVSSQKGKRKSRKVERNFDLTLTHVTVSCTLPGTASPVRSNQRTSYRTTQCAMEKCCDTCVCGSTVGKYGLAWQPENVQPPNVQSRRVLQQRTVSDRFSWRLTVTTYRIKYRYMPARLCRNVSTHERENTRVSAGRCLVNCFPGKR